VNELVPTTAFVGALEMLNLRLDINVEQSTRSALMSSPSVYNLYKFSILMSNSQALLFFLLFFK